MKHFVTGLIAAAVLATGAQAQQKIVVGHALSPTSHYGVGAQAFIDTLTELSGGTFTGEQAPAGQLGGERDMIEGLQIGSLDLVVTSTGPLGNFVPEVFALDLPFLFRDYDTKLAMIEELRQPITPQMVIQEINRYADSEFRYADKSDEVAIDNAVREMGRMEEAKRRYLEQKR